MHVFRLLFLGTVIVACAPPEGDDLQADPGVTTQASAVVTATGLYKVAAYPAIMQFNSDNGRVCYVTGEEWGLRGSPAPTLISLSDMDTLINSHPPTGKTCSYEEVHVTNQSPVFPWGTYRSNTNVVWRHENGNKRRACQMTAMQYANLGSPAAYQLSNAQTIDFLVAFGPRDGSQGNCTANEIGI